MGAVPFPEDQKSLVILVDKEHWCQLFYPSPPVPRLPLWSEPSMKHERPRVTRPVAFMRSRHGPAPPVASGVSYVADAPGRARSTRISPTREIRGVISSTGQLYGPDRSRSSVGTATAL